MRKAFAEGLLEAAEVRSEVVFLTGDLGYGTFDTFKDRFGPRYLNVGVAEAALIDVAAGLASEGKRPVVYSIASFASGRPFEQIRVAVAYAGLPVVIIGAGGGYTYASSGVTHHAIEDLALMCLLPGMTVVAPGDPLEVRALLPQLLRLDGPAYMRVGRYGEADVPSSEPIELGVARWMRSGSGVAIVTLGEVLPAATRAVEQLQQQGHDPLLLHFHTLKPLDEVALDRAAATTHTFLVVEEHCPTGGLAAAIASWCAAATSRPRVIRRGAPDALTLGGPSREAVHERYGMDTTGILTAYRAATEG